MRVINGFIWLLAVGVILALPPLARAQEATIVGTVTDTTGGVLPGVTVTAVHEASGNSFTAVTDARGEFRMPVRIGAYRLAAELQSFATVTRTGLELLVGQQAVVNLQMAPSGLQESLTVTGEAPLIDVTQSKVGGNIDARQVSELPVNGRNWLDLAMLAPGSRANAVSTIPVPDPAGQIGGVFQVTLDGQLVTQQATSRGGYLQPSFSRDSIAEFEFIANRFDATQGRSSGIIINAVTKSGTNTPSGTFSGYFRNDRFNAADFIQKRVLPYSNQQWSGTFGGPIRRDKIHFFVHYEYEREPQVITFSSPWPRFNIDLPTTRQEHKGGGRLDVQLSSRASLFVRGSGWASLQPHNPEATGGASRHPSTDASINQYDREIFGGLTRVLSSRTVNQIKLGYNRWNVDQQAGVETAPPVALRGFTIGPPGTAPFVVKTPRYSLRDDLTHSYTLGGRHDLKVGAEYTRFTEDIHWCNTCRGTIDATGGPVPANIEDLLPVWNDPSTWNLAPLSPISVRYRQGVGTFHFLVKRHIVGTWAQDDWAITSRLTLNLGVRYDLMTNPYANATSIPPFIPVRPVDKNNFAPRLGLAYSLSGRTVLRGGFGKYFQEMDGSNSIFLQAASIQIVPETPNDGRPDFAARPYNGPPLTYAQALQRTCPVSPGPSCVRRDLPQNMTYDVALPFSYQTTIGVQQQLGETMAVTADYAYIALRGLPDYRRNVNLTYNPATGANYPFTDLSRRPFPDWGVLQFNTLIGRTNDHGLQMGFTKRLSAGWQASATYTLAGRWNATAWPAAASTDGTRLILTPLPFETVPDLGGEYALAETDQRHRAVVNGIWEIPYGFQLSGLYFYGSGSRFITTYGADLRNVGGGGENRLRPDGTIVPRNNFVGRPLHRVDLRVQRKFRLGGRVAIDGILEAFNLFNHENYGNYVTVETARNYGAPSAVLNTAYQPRQLQLGFRATF